MAGLLPLGLTLKLSHENRAKEAEDELIIRHMNWATYTGLGITVGTTVDKS